MTYGDLQQVMEIDRASFPNPWPERSFHYELRDNPSSALFVAETGDEGLRQVVGFLGYWLIGDEVHISTFAVHPEFRMMGIGQRLLLDALGEAATRGAEQATLEVRKSNQSAISLYQKLGFVAVGSRPGYYRDNGEEAILMTLNDIKEIRR